MLFVLKCLQQGANQTRSKLLLTQHVIGTSEYLLYSVLLLKAHKDM